MSDQIYIHYGADHFDPSKGFPIKNRDTWNKPKGGLWASRIDATYGWEDWCLDEDFRVDSLDVSFQFKLKPGSNVYAISTMHDLERLPKAQIDERYAIYDTYYIDFEQCLKDGIDAIELCWYGDEFKLVQNGNIHYALYGWDCDSMVVLNPNIVEEITPL